MKTKNFDTTGAGMKVKTQEERVLLRKILARGTETFTECPCGWFYKADRCPDKTCTLWKPKGPVTMKFFAHENSENWYDDGKKLGLQDDALRNFAHWGYEIEFDGEVDLKTGEVTLLTVNGRKIEPEKQK